MSSSCPRFEQSHPEKISCRSYSSQSLHSWSAEHVHPRYPYLQNCHQQVIHPLNHWLNGFPRCSLCCLAGPPWLLFFRDTPGFCLFLNRSYSLISWSRFLLILIVCLMKNHARPPPKYDYVLFIFQFPVILWVTYCITYSHYLFQLLINHLAIILTEHLKMKFKLSGNAQFWNELCLSSRG